MLRAALRLGVQPGHASLKALLACCSHLEAPPGRSPLGRASGGVALRLTGPGGDIDLAHVLAACQEAIQQQQQRVAVAACASGSAVAPTASDAARQLAADLLRTWAFSVTFDFVSGVTSHGPTWPLRRGDAVDGGEMAGHSAASASDDDTAAASAWQ